MYIGPDPDNPNLYIYQTAYGERIKSALPPTEFRDHRRGAPGTITPGVAEALPASELPPVPASVGGAPQWIQNFVKDPQAAGESMRADAMLDEESAWARAKQHEWAAEDAFQTKEAEKEAARARGEGLEIPLTGEVGDPADLMPRGVGGLTLPVSAEDIKAGRRTAGTATDQPPAPEGPPPTVTPSARMASIRAKLAEIATLRKNAVKGQRASLDALTTDYQTELDRIKDESKITDARGRINRANAALGTVTNKLANFEINPQRAFPNAFSKVAAVISVAMGAYAQGLSGGKLPNTALQIINTAIDRDIDAQKMEYQKLKGLVDEKRNVYAMAMRMLGDERQADALLRTAAHQAFGTRFKTQSQQMGIENSQISQAYQEAGLLQSENAARARLDVLAAKTAQSASEPPKISKEAKASVAAARGMTENLEGLAAKAEDVGPTWLGLTWLSSKVPFIATDSKKYVDASKQMVLRMVNATSGKTMTKYEHELFKSWTPWPWETAQQKHNKMHNLLTSSSDAAVGWLSTEPVETQEYVLRSNASLRGIMDPQLSHGERRRNVDLLMGRISRGSEYLNAPAYGTERTYGK